MYLTEYNLVLSYIIDMGSFVYDVTGNVDEYEGQLVLRKACQTRLLAEEISSIRR
jgi:hypothetical protein